MMLFGKVPAGTKANPTRYVKQMKKGYLSLPLLGIAIEIECGRDVLHLQLANTMHAADTSRNTQNFSSVIHY